MKFLLFILLISLSVMAKPRKIGVVSDIEGQAFAIYQGKVASLQRGSPIYDTYEVLVEDDGHLQIDDYHLHSFYIAGGTQLIFDKNLIELKTGKIWVKSLNKEQLYTLNTSQGVALFTDAQFIYEFDPYNQIDQILLLNGELEVQNAFESTYARELKPGEFTIIDGHSKDRYPRAPTMIGPESYEAIRGSFARIQALKNNEFDRTLKSIARNDYSDAAENFNRKLSSPTPSSSGMRGSSRAIASVPNHQQGMNSSPSPSSYLARKRRQQHKNLNGLELLKTEDKPKEGKLYVRKKIKPKDTNPVSALEYYKVVKPKKKVVVKPKKIVPFTFLGSKPSKRKPARNVASVKNSKSSARNKAPASSNNTVVKPVAQKEESSSSYKQGKSELLNSLNSVKNEPARSIASDPFSKFEKTLKKEEGKQKRHSNGVNNLINDLKSYDNNFDESY